MKIRRPIKAIAALIVLVLIGMAVVSNHGSSTPRVAGLRASLASATRVAEGGNGSGYWLVASDGGVFTFGTAQFYGSMGGKHLSSPITGIVATADGHGYWLVAKDGGVFSFGDAAFEGSMGGMSLAAPMVGMASSSGGGSGATEPQGAAGPPGVAGATGPAGQAGAQGPGGPVSIVTRTASFSVDLGNTTGFAATARCNSGEIVTGGGFEDSSQVNAWVTSDAPFADTTSQGWKVAMAPTGLGQPPGPVVTVYALCAMPGI